MLQVDLFLNDLFNNTNKQTVLLLQENRMRKMCIMRIVKIAEHTLLCMLYLHWQYMACSNTCIVIFGEKKAQNCALPADLSSNLPAVL